MSPALPSSLPRAADSCACSSTSQQQPQSLDVVVLGGGIIGLCTAYYLLKSTSLSSSSTVTLIETSRSKTIANGSSSKAGGFIARDWHKSASTSLAKLSWKCHEMMSRELDGTRTYGWQTVKAIGLRVGGDKDQDRSKYRLLPGQARQENGFGWLSDGEKEDLTNGRGGQDAGIAQIDPAQFCRTVHAHLALDSRFKTVFGSPQSLSSNKHVLTVRLTDSPNAAPLALPVSKLVIAAGPWSAAVCAQLRLPRINLTNLPGHSLLIRPAVTSEASTIDPCAVFAGIGPDANLGVEHATGGTGRLLTAQEQAMGYTEAPELFTRLNGLVYVAGENTVPNAPNRKLQNKSVGNNRLPENVDDVQDLLDENLLERLKVAAEAVSELLRVSNGATIEAQQLCYRPKTFDGECMIGPLCDNVLIATGHGPWGITLAPGTGKVMSEMVLGSRLSADVSQLSVDRCRADDQASLQAARL
ncbi:hypothetical protein ACM66B_003836 [Microbotryomycetes sp. NB124-2]